MLCGTHHISNFTSLPLFTTIPAQYFRFCVKHQYDRRSKQYESYYCLDAVKLLSDVLYYM